MVNIDAGTYGAKRQSFKRNDVNPRALLRELLEANRNLSKEESRTRHLSTIRESENYEAFVEAIHEYWHSNNYNSLVPETESQTKKTAIHEEKEKTKNHIKQKLKKAIKAEALKIALDFVMPNGKALGDCTFAEIGKIGGAWSKLATGGKPNQKVRAVFKTDAAATKYCQQK